MSLSVWVLLNFLEAKGLCLFLTKYFVKPSNKSCQQSKVKQKKKKKKRGSLGHQFVFLLSKTWPHKNAPTDSVSFSVKDKAKNLLPQKWNHELCLIVAEVHLLLLMFLRSTWLDLTWLELTLRHASTSRRFMSGNYVLSLFYSSLKTPKQTSWYQFVDFYE